MLSIAFFAGAVANAIMLLTAPAIYEGFADFSFFPLYRSLWRRLVLPRLSLWVVLVLILEVVLGVLLISADPYARLGLILAAAFTAFLVPFWWGGRALVNVLLLALMVWLLRFDYGASVPSLLFGG